MVKGLVFYFDLDVAWVYKIKQQYTWGKQHTIEGPCDTYII
jgi:hypothetical protein